MEIQQLKMRKHFNDLDGAITGLHKMEDSAAMIYQENSKLTGFSMRTMAEKIGMYNNPYLNKRTANPYKVHPGAPIISLEEYKNYPAPKLDIYSVLNNRRSVREFEKTAISYNELFRLCHYSYGVSGGQQMQGTSSVWKYRRVPSAGALYPLEIYIVVLNGMMPSGIYHYRPDINALEFIKEGDFYPTVGRITSAEPWVKLEDASCVVFTTGIFERLMIKYGERGYRFMLMEAGAVAQNMSLVAEAIGLGACQVGAYMDDQVNDFLGIKSAGETVCNLMVLGSKKEEEEED